MSDRGFTHVALTVRDATASVAFYERYGGFDVVHERVDDVTGHHVVWLSDHTRPFVIVLIEAETPSAPLAGFNHLGVGVDGRDEVDRLAHVAADEGCLVLPPVDVGPPVGYIAIMRDPDGHQLELSFGQDVGLAAVGRGPSTSRVRPDRPEPAAAATEP